MPLTVRLAATLRKYIAGYDAATGYAIAIDQGTSVREVAERLSIPEQEVKLIMVDGAHAEWETVLKGNERLALFPPIGGG
jgi:sulfur-carrier protein